jgi:hypothetical protein
MDCISKKRIIMTEDKESKDVLVVSDGMKKYNPIQEQLKKSGVTMPDLVAHGTLSVDTHEEVEKMKQEKFDKKKIPLPELGDKFMLNSHEYVVTYINPGQHRFTCEPCKGIY